MLKQLLGQLADLEERYACDTCGYCRKRQVYRADLPCGHAFCASCCEKLIRVTKIGKATGQISANETDEAKLVRCPYCSELTILSDDLLNELA